MSFGPFYYLFVTIITNSGPLHTIIQILIALFLCPLASDDDDCHYLRLGYTKDTKQSVTISEIYESEVKRKCGHNSPFTLMRDMRYIPGSTSMVPAHNF